MAGKHQDKLQTVSFHFNLHNKLVYTCIEIGFQPASYTYMLFIKIVHRSRSLVARQQSQHRINNHQFPHWHLLKKRAGCSCSSFSHGWLVKNSGDMVWTKLLGNWEKDHFEIHEMVYLKCKKEQKEMKRTKREQKGGVKWKKKCVGQVNSDSP